MTIFTTTDNRTGTLPRLFESLVQQTSRAGIAGIWTVCLTPGREILRGPSSDIVDVSWSDHMLESWT